MVIEKTKAFNSKILLFGEYALMKGSTALSIPFDKYIGQLLFDQTSTHSQSKHYSVNYLLDSDLDVYKDSDSRRSPDID